MIESKYEENAKIFKALCEPNRLKIIDILSCGELCACRVLQHFNFTQPTLSHHMKVLSECNLVIVRKEGTWNYYSLNRENCTKLLQFFSETVECANGCNSK